MSEAEAGEHASVPPASETTPLLTGSAGQEDEAVVTTSSSPPKPLPKIQVALLCFARLIEPIAFFSIFPFINEMVRDNGGLADADVGFYSGLIESLFSLAQAATMLGWGRAADRVGRKPVLVLSLVGMSGATGLFGLARTLPQMVLFRCLAGVFSGTIVTIRTMLAEHGSPSTQARIFSWFAFSGNLGIFLGPLLGGVLADPLQRQQHNGHNAHGGSHGGSGGEGTSGPLRGSWLSWVTRYLVDDAPEGLPFLAVYPYALPCFVIACLGFLAAATSAIFIEETLRKEPSSHASSSSSPASPSSPSPSIRKLLRAPGVGIVLYIYGYVMLLAFSYTAIVPVFWFTPITLGGLGFSKREISAMMCLAGASQAVWLLFVFPPLQHRVGTNGVMRICAYAYPIFFAVMPAIAALLRYPPILGSHQADVARTIFWIVAPLLLSLGSGVSMCFTAAQLAVNDVAPSPQLLGTLNGLALTGVSTIRAFTPALFTSLYAIGANTQWLDGYAIWNLMVALALGYTVLSQYLPDYEEIKRQREQEVEED